MINPDKLHSTSERHPTLFSEGVTKRLAEIKAALLAAQTANPELYKKTFELLYGQSTASDRPPMNFNQPEPKELQPTKILNLDSTRFEVEKSYQYYSNEEYKDAA